MKKFLTKEQRQLMNEIDLYVENMQLPHIPKTKVLTLVKSKFNLFQEIINKEKKVPGIIDIQGNKYKGFEIRSA